MSSVRFCQAVGAVLAVAAAGAALAQSPATQPASRPVASASAPAGAARAQELYERGLDVQRRGKLDEAVQLFAQAVKADPACVPALNHFAWLRATNRDAKYRSGPEAVAMAQSAVKVLKAQEPTRLLGDCLDTLAASYAEAGRSEEAVQAAKEAAQVADEQGNRMGARDFERRKKRYEQKQPHRE